MISSPLRRLLCLSLLLCITACWERQVDVPRLVPAALHFPNTHTVAIGTISGEGGDDLGDLITHSLQGKKHFAVLERSAVLDMVREQHFNAMDPVNVRHLGKPLGADTLVFGRVLKNTVEVHVSRRVVTNLRGQERLRFTREGSYKLRVLLRAVDARTGMVLGSRDLAVDEALNPSVMDIDDMPHWDGRAPFKPVDAYGIQLDAYTRIADRFVHDITPHWVKETVSMYEDSRIPMSKAAITAAHRGDWQTAIDIYRRGVAQADGDPRIPARFRACTHYNLGVALAFSGQFEDGIVHLRRAMDIWGCDLFAHTLSRSLAFKEDADAASQQIKEVACQSGARQDGWCPVHQNH